MCGSVSFSDLVVVAATDGIGGAIGFIDDLQISPLLGAWGGSLTEVDFLTWIIEQDDFTKFNQQQTSWVNSIVALTL